jgi:uncharacterized repeat protein (TIGR01451 family)
MNARRRAFRPDVVGVLESRLVLSSVALPADVRRAHNTAERVDYASVTDPQFTVTCKGSDGSDTTRVLTRTGRIGDGELVSSVSTQLPTAEMVAIGVPPDEATIWIYYHNNSQTHITSATISDTLDTDLTYVAGSATSTDGGTVTVNTGANGVQTVQLSLPSGIAPNARGYLEFQVTKSGLPTSVI